MPLGDCQWPLKKVELPTDYVDQRSIAAGAIPTCTWTNQSKSDASKFRSCHCIDILTATRIWLCNGLIFYPRRHRRESWNHERVDWRFRWRHHRVHHTANHGRVDHDARVSSSGGVHWCEFRSSWYNDMWQWHVTVTCYSKSDIWQTTVACVQSHKAVTCLIARSIVPTWGPSGADRT